MKNITIKQLDKYIGRRRGWYIKKPEDVKFARDIVHLLYDYDSSKEYGLKNFVENNNYELKLLEENKDIVVIHPKNTGHFSVLYNINKDCKKWIISYPHESSDNIKIVGYELMLNSNYKCMIINGFSIAASAGEPSPYQPGRTNSNADHSPSSSFSDFIDEFLNNSQHKQYNQYVLHGMTSNKPKKVWFISSTGTRTIKDLNKNVCFFMCVAWALDKNFNEMYGQTNYNFDEFYTLREDGTKKFLTGTRDSKNCYFGTFRGPTSSVCSHIMNAEKITKNQGKDKGRNCHAEHAITTIGNRAYKFSMFHNEVNRLMKLAENKNMKDAPRDLNELILWLENA